jgi:[ribosomal protein S18]-alanine N-acetyltransferase
MINLLPRPRVFVDDAKFDEAAALVDIHADAFARGWSEDEFTALISDRNVFALGIRRVSFFGARRLMGFVIIRVAADEAEILTIAVGRSRRGRGYGRLLMEEAMRRLYRDRVVSCFLEVDRGNGPAVGLYRALGFEEVGLRKGYYDSPAGADGTALVMRLQLR